MLKKWFFATCVQSFFFTSLYISEKEIKMTAEAEEENGVSDDSTVGTKKEKKEKKAFPSKVPDRSP
jgi:hypothetical protein